MALSLPVLTAGTANAAPFINHFHNIKFLATTVPSGPPSVAGDQNPYGVAVVHHSEGKLVRGDVLVSNFNNGQNQQGTGSSIMEVSPGGSARLFAAVPPPTSAGVTGLTTALVWLKSGYVIVGSLPAPQGMAANATAGALTVLNSHGHVVETITAKDINGPWDMTAVDSGTHVVLFITNVLNGTVAAKGGVAMKGTVVRLTLRIHRGEVPKVTSNKVIAEGFAEHTDPNALVVGPTGVGLGSNGVLYVADSNGNRIASVPDALGRTEALGNGGHTVSMNGALNDPLGLAIAPNGDVLTLNGSDGDIVETSANGRRTTVKQLIANGGGDLFGLAVAPRAEGIYFVNDIGSGPAANSLELLH